MKENDLWRTLSMHGVSSALIQALQCLYRGSSACIRINRPHTDWFDFRRGIRQVCVASPWLFMDSCLYDLKENKRRMPSGRRKLSKPCAVDVQAVGDAHAGKPAEQRFTFVLAHASRRAETERPIS
ncbi:hypothetical protein EVAR_3064_1 [Eumeta japonica]|uniref:Uncharacterized protein n=1 Tax=Eumeta variegata TaxID=151549 RepID=A0A4C1SUH4_EUMVA|nr:hypothetical protein EVAR_3064_1 [Eumeta japonica]